MATRACSTVALDQLIAGCEVDQILQQQDELAGLIVQVGGEAARYAHTEPRGDLLVEAHLTLVAADGHRHLAVLRRACRALGDQRARCAVLVTCVRQAKPGHLAQQTDDPGDRFVDDARHGRSRFEVPTVAERLGQPFGGDG